MIKELVSKLKISRTEETTPADEEVKKDETKENDSKVEANETKTVILTKLLSEVTFFARKVKNLESELYKKEQVTEAAQAEAFLEKGDEKKQIGEEQPDEDAEKVTEEEDGDRKQGAFFKIIKNALGILLTLLPILFKGFDDVKKMFGELPDIMNTSFSNIVLSLFGKLQNVLNEYVFDPIANYLTNTISELWKSLVLSVEETFINVIGSLPTFLKDNLPDVIKGMVQSATEDVAQSKTPGKPPEIELTVGSTGSFGATEGAKFGGEYKPPEYGTPAPPPTPAQAPAPAGGVSTPAAPSMGMAVPSAPSSTAAMPETPQTGTAAPSDATRIFNLPQSKDAVSAMPKVTQDVDENFGLVETALKNLGIDDPKYVRAVKANIMKESGGKAIEENLRYGGTDNSRIREIFGERARRFTDAQLNEIKKDPVKMGEMMYGPDTKIGRGMGNTQPGDGYKFRGRGFIQLTGRTNYAIASKELFKDDRLVQNPDLVLDPTIAALTTAWYMKRGKTQMAKRLGIDESNMTQEEANLLATSQIAGSDVSKWKGSYGRELLSKVGSYAEQLGPSSTVPTQVASTEILPVPPAKGAEIGATTQAVKEVTEKKEEEEQRVVIQTAMAAQQQRVSIEDPKRAAGAGVGSSRPPAPLIQRSYTDYFAVA